MPHTSRTLVNRMANLRTQDEEFRAETKARYYRQTGGKRDAVDSVIQSITKKRGQEAAERLRADMRRLHREGGRHGKNQTPDH